MRTQYALCACTGQVGSSLRKVMYQYVDESKSKRLRVEQVLLHQGGAGIALNILRGGSILITDFHT